jgi:integrase
MAQLAVRTLITPSGERLPMLIDRSTGMPVFYPNLYVLTELRQINRASATMERALREISVLHDYLNDVGIDLDERIREGRLFSLGEIDGLARHCRQAIRPSMGSESGSKAHVRRFGKNELVLSQPVSQTTAANRLRTIHAYLSWLIALRLSTIQQREVFRTKLEQIRENVLPALRARIPISKGRNILNLRQGLVPELVERLLQIIDPSNSENPWKSEFIRQRNAMIVCWLLQLGVRRGELLNVMISDVDFRKNTVTIARRPDDPQDPRRMQPKVKTRDRILPLSPELAALSLKYITTTRSQLAGNKRHSYLFVAEHTGAPMSLSSLNKMFQKLRLSIPELPDNLSGHMLRHTWNDEFSRKLEGKGVGEAKEEQMRSYLMGWSPTSSTSRIYTRRFVEEAARQASLNLQEKIIMKDNE